MSAAHDRIKVIEFSFFNGENEEKCVLSIAYMSDFDLENVEEWLSVKELEKLNSFGLEKRKKQYYLGRLTTKKALSLLADGLTFQAISVVNEKSGHPIIENSSYATTITHTNEIVASLVFKSEFSFGIDVENVRKGSAKAIRSAISDEEQIVDDIESLTVAWTLKESLSKALKCGFRAPFEEFELTNFSQNNNIFFCSYAKHREFNGIALTYNDCSFAITYPAGICKLSSLPY
jgi:phosphopantetheinyl transferase (holo-ACP synthase)